MVNPEGTTFNFEDYNIHAKDKSAQTCWDYVLSPCREAETNLLKPHLADYNTDPSFVSDVPRTKDPASDTIVLETKRAPSFPVEPDYDLVRWSEDALAHPRLVDPFHDDWPHW